MAYKSICVAYFLLIFGGFAGLHLLYLRRDIQAFLYWCTFGGYFGLGPFRDLFRLPAYVKDFNNDPDFTAALARKIIKKRRPPFSFTRFAAQVAIGNSWSYLWIDAVPDIELFDTGISLKLIKYLAPLTAAIGVWLVGNIGREKGSLKWAVIGSFFMLPFASYEFYLINFCSISSALLFTFKGKQWRRTPYSENSFCKRFTMLTCGWLLFCSIWTVYILFNAEVSYEGGEKIKLKDAIYNFFKSPMFLEFKNNTWKLLDDIKMHGWSEAFKNLVELIDPLGEIHALNVLNLPRNATQEEITSTYKKLSREWHPDRHKDPERKEEAHEKFIEIAQAYDALSVIKRRRAKRNKKSVEEDVDVKTYLKSQY